MSNHQPFVCEYDYSVALISDRGYIESLALERYPDYTEVDYDHFNKCWLKFITDTHIDKTWICVGNYSEFVLDGIKYFAIVTNPGLNAEQWLYGQVADKQ